MRHLARPRTPMTPVRRRCSAGAASSSPAGAAASPPTPSPSFSTRSLVARARRPHVGVSIDRRRHRGRSTWCCATPPLPPRIARTWSSAWTAPGVEGAQPVDRHQRRARRAGGRTGHDRPRRQRRPSPRVLPTAAVTPPDDDEWLGDWVDAGAAAESHIERVLGQQPALHRAGGGAHDRTRAAGRGRARGRLVDAGARPRVVRRSHRPGPRQPGGQRHRRHDVDGARPRPVGDGPSSYCSATSPSSTMPERSRPCDGAASTCGWSWSTTTAGASSRSSRRRRPSTRRGFEQLFGTPHGTDLVALAGAHGLDAATVATPAELVVRLGRRGPHVTRIATDRAANVAVHAAVNAWRVD